LDYPVKAEGVTTKQISLDMKISRRRVQQIWKSYSESKQEPAIGENMGWPRKPFDEREAEVIGEAYQLYRFGARMLEVAVRNVFKICISHNCIHMYLKAADLAHEDTKKKKRRKWFDMNASIACLQDISIGMNQVGQISRFCVIIDDASRMILAGGEFKNINTENSKLAVDELVEKILVAPPHARVYLGSRC